MPSSGPSVRLLLIELLNDDPLHQHRITQFPFIQGHLRQRGATVEWVSVAAGREHRPAHPYEVSLHGPGLAALERRLADGAWSHVLINERCAPSMLERLQARCPEAVWLEPPQPLLQSASVEHFEAWGRLPPWSGPPHAPLLEHATPDYLSHRLDPEQETAEHFVPLIGGDRCTYYRPLATNPHFAVLALDSYDKRRGCSFCGRRHSGGRPLPAMRLMELALLQYRRYHETQRPERWRNRFLLFVAPGHRAMERLLDGLLEVDRPPARFYFGCRVDEFLAMERAIEERLGALHERGHRLDFWQMGLENFSPLENERFNKGISVAQIERAVAIIDRWERDWRQTFSFREHGGFGMIVFTPWTRLEDLRINLRQLTRLRLEAQQGLLLSSLQLRKGSALHALACRDELIADSGDLDPFLATCITHWGEDSLPWKFRNRPVGTVFEALIALYGHPLSDPPFSAPRRAIEERGHIFPPGPAEAMELACDWIELHPEASAAELLAALARKPARPSEPEPATVATPKPAPPSWASHLARVLTRAFDGRSVAFPPGRLLDLRIRRDSDGSVVVALELALDDDRVALLLQPTEEGRPAYRQAGAWSLCHSRGSSCEGREARQLLANLLALLERLEPEPR